MNARNEEYTEMQNEAREKLRVINSQGLADNRYTRDDLPEDCLEVYIIDNRFKNLFNVKITLTPESDKILKISCFDKLEFIGTKTHLLAAAKK